MLGGLVVEDIFILILLKLFLFGEEFGGFLDFVVLVVSSSDLWGSNIKEDDNDVWGNDDWDIFLIRFVFFVYFVEEVIEEEEVMVDDEEGVWGVFFVGYSLGMLLVMKLKGDDDWEEVWRRIKI